MSLLVLTERKGVIMGLDIHVLINLIPTSPDKDSFHLMNEPVFDRPDDHFINDSYYNADSAFGFCAGSYGSYNRWRSELCESLGKKIQDVWDNNLCDYPCYELINFSDCQGWIGPTISEKLFHDISKYETEINMDDRSMSILDDFKRGFEIAMLNKGVVIFC